MKSSKRAYAYLAEVRTAAVCCLAATSSRTTITCGHLRSPSLVERP